MSCEEASKVNNQLTAVDCDISQIRLHDADIQKYNIFHSHLANHFRIASLQIASELSIDAAEIPNAAESLHSMRQLNWVRDGSDTKVRVDALIVEINVMIRT